MSQHLVDVVEETQARRRGLQPVQPQGVPAHPQKMSRVTVDQVVTMMTRSSLKVREGRFKKAGWLAPLIKGTPPRAVTDHNGDVMAIRQREGPVHVQDVVLCAQETLQVLRVRGHLLGHGVHAPCADQSLGEEQRHAFLLTVHHHLHGTDGRFKNNRLDLGGLVRYSSVAQGQFGGQQLICGAVTPAMLLPPAPAGHRTHGSGLRIAFCELKVNRSSTLEGEREIGTEVWTEEPRDSHL